MEAIYLNIKYFFKNYYFVFFKTDNKPKSFYGYGKYWLAKKYADKRTESGSPDGVTGRKRHFCFPYGNGVIMVCNRTEVNGMVKSKLISKRVDITYMIEHAFYISKILIFAFILFSCQKSTFCWQCRSEVNKRVEYFEICNKTEPEIRQFERQYTVNQLPIITSMRCQLKRD